MTMEPTTTAVAVKSVGYLGAVVFFEYLGVRTETFTILAVLMVIDTITAIAREWVVNPKGISSRVGIIGLLSKLLVLLVPLVIALVAKGANYDLAFLVNACLALMVTYEGYSIIANIAQIRAKDKTISEYDAISYFLKKVTDVFKGILDAMMKK